MARRLLPLLVIAAALLVPAQALAADVGGPEPFGAAPATSSKLGPRSYYTFTIAPGGAGHDKIVVSNEGKKPQTLKIGVSTGTTAAGSGDAYANAFGACKGPACWITGLPSSVTLAGKARRTIPFTVSVPAGTADRQYLAGITVQPAKTGGPTRLGRSGGAGAQATIVQQVVVGVAVTVGDISQLVSRLKIDAVSAGTVGKVPRLLIGERNVGQTFLHARGVAVCTASGAAHTFPVVSSTILPGDGTTLIVNARGLPNGKSASCRLSLAYGGSGAAASVAWRGVVHVPALPSSHVVQTGPGSFSTVPNTHKGTPVWAYALIGIGALVVILLVAMLIVLLRRPRRT